MLVRDAVQKIKKGALPATVILCGEAEYIRSVGVRELTGAAQVEMPDLNVMTFEGRPPMSSLRDALGRPPILSAHKVVILRNTDLFVPRNGPDAGKPVANMTVEAHTLFIVDAGPKLDRRRASVKQLLKAGMLVECNPLRGDALDNYIVALGRQRRLHISKTCARSLAERCEDDLYVITSELDKLRHVCTGEITAVDLDRYCPPEPEASVFAIQDLMLSGRYEEAKGAVDNLLRNDPYPMGFLTMTANSLRQMLIARTCRDAGYAQQKTISIIMAETGAKDWAARRAYERCTRMPAARLRRALRRLSEVDFGSKQGLYTLTTDLYALLYDIYVA